MTISVREIAGLVALAFEIDPEELLGHGRSRSIRQTRFMAMWLASKHGASAALIGRIFGKRDHATVLNAVARAQETIDAGGEFAEAAMRLKQTIEWKAYAARDREVDALALARRIYVDPRRAGMAASVHDVHALAATVLQLWDVAVAAEALAAARARPVTGDDETDHERDVLIAALERAIADQMAALRGDEHPLLEEETNDAD